MEEMRSKLSNSTTWSSIMVKKMIVAMAHRRENDHCVKIALRAVCLIETEKIVFILSAPNGRLYIAMRCDAMYSV